VTKTNKKKKKKKHTLLFPDLLHGLLHFGALSDLLQPVHSILRHFSVAVVFGGGG